MFSKIVAGCTIALFVALIGSITHRSHKKLDRFSILSSKLRDELRNILSVLKNKSGHPASVVENITIDNLVSDILTVIPISKRKVFSRAWEEYRYDQQHRELESFPAELTRMGTVDSRRLIEKRIHSILSILE